MLVFWAPSSNPKPPDVRSEESVERQSSPLALLDGMTAPDIFSSPTTLIGCVVPFVSRNSKCVSERSIYRRVNSPEVFGPFEGLHPPTALETMTNPNRSTRTSMALRLSGKLTSAPQKKYRHQLKQRCRLLTSQYVCVSSGTVLRIGTIAPIT